MRWRAAISLLLLGCGARTELAVEDGGPPPRLTDVVSIAAGARASCALREGGQLTCWGEPAGYERVRFPGTGEQTSVPVDLFRFPGAVELSLSIHWCVLLDTGRVLCWGDNCAGQLARRDVHRSREPEEVDGIDDAIDVATGWAHTCVVRRSGEVWCWGLNDHGQLGDGTFTEEALFTDCDESVGSYGSRGRAEPRPVPGITTAVEVASTHDHTCARLESGRVTCWGRGEYGQFGDRDEYGGGETTAYDRPTPVEVPELEDAVQVAAGFNQACVRLQNGLVVCWGGNANGQLGDGTRVSSERPVDVLGLGPALDVSAGGATTCAVRTDGEVWCWGGNERCHAGTWVGESRERMRVVPGPVDGVVQAAQVAAGHSHACELETDGTVRCWGGDSGHLVDAALGRGDGVVTTVPCATPVVGFGR